MPTTTLRDMIREVRATYKALDAACAGRATGWRHDVVRLRREVADQMARMGGLVAGVEPPNTPAVATFRNYLSNLRSVVAELQARWPAVSLDPDAPSYRQSVERVRLCLERLEASLAPLDSRPSQ